MFLVFPELWLLVFPLGPLVLSEVPATDTHVQENCPHQPRSRGLSKDGPRAH